MTTPVVEVHDLVKAYPLDGADAVMALRGIDLTIAAGEFVAVMGPSGSGKSTFMHIIGFLDRPTSGTYLFAGHDVSTLDAEARADLRSHALGFVFQSYNLLPRTTALENVELPMVYARIPERRRREAARRALAAVGLAGVETQLPNQLSGGQQQRVAIARSIVNDPQLILADEPTGALDTKASQDVMGLFRRLNEDHGMTVMIVTHERDVAAFAKRLVMFRDGRIVSDTPIENGVPA